MKITKHKFGRLSNGKKVELFTVKNRGISFSATNFGCTLTSLLVPSKTGKVDDIVLGFSTLDGYVNTAGPYFGAFIGRFANRIKNAQFSLNNTPYELDKNNGNHCLHGGFLGYDKMIFDAEEIETKQGCGVRFTRISPDGEQGFPGTVAITVVYLLTENNELIMRYSATTDKETPINVTNHSYFNLSGNLHQSILEHELTLHADTYLPVDATLIPTGVLQPVENTPFDFRTAKKIGHDIDKVSGGYDHCYVLCETKGKLTVAASVVEPVSGRKMTLTTNQPGVQFYSGNFLSNYRGKYGQIHEKHQGFCLETQFFPDSPNQKNFPSCILSPNAVYESENVFSFSW